MGMFILMTLLTGLVGLSLGFLFGPFFEWAGEKVKNSESAKRSEQESIATYNNKVAGATYDKGSNNPVFSPERKEKFQERLHIIITIIVFGALIGLVSFGSVVFSKILIGVFLLILIREFFNKGK